MFHEKKPRVNIVSWDSGGLSKDIDLISESLQRSGCDVAFKGRKHRIPRNRIQSLLMTMQVLMAERLSSITGRRPFDVNIFIESIFPEYLPLARKNALFVNPEWFRDEVYNYLAKVDLLLLKTADGLESVRDLDASSRYIGFTSVDRRIEGFVRDDRKIRCLHLSGQSALKGTDAVVEAWARHPEWPELTVVRRAKRYGGEDAEALPVLPNVVYLTEFVPEDELRRLQNECIVHVVPSLAEGYGHVIGEAMSCGAVVVTTDAPPMNELVRPDRGVLVRVDRILPKDRSKLNYVDIADLERVLLAVFEMPESERSSIGRKAREWFETQDSRFHSKIKELIDSFAIEGAH